MLETDQTCRVKDRVRWTAGGCNLQWLWSRDPVGRTRGELDYLTDLLNSFVMLGGSQDTWCWKFSTKGDFTTKKLASLIDEKTILDTRTRPETLKNSLVPGKIEIFIWRALRKRLATRVDLDIRGVDLHSVRCPLCDDGLETTDHALFLCIHSFEVWERVYKWWGLGPVSNISINEACRGKSNTPFSRFGVLLWQALEWVCSYLIWRNRNLKVFSNKCWTGPTALMEIQLKSFECITPRLKKSKIEWTRWLSNPLVYAL
ncbi:uncharacterized protein [Rutidosis leptorrhynchoides]|uniref:uncharacterized protein n=1 Tax=Rutidosis leptorrhynchoides TaxID=125765 RepID=UPI003A9A2CE4